MATMKRARAIEADRGIAPGFESLRIEERAAIVSALRSLKRFGTVTPWLVGLSVYELLRRFDFIRTAKGGARIEATNEGLEALEKWEAHNGRVDSSR